MPSRLEQGRIGLRLRRRLGERSKLPPPGHPGRERWIAEQLADLRRHAVDRSPFYRSLHAGLDGAPLGELPVVTKADLVDKFDDAVADRKLTRAAVERFVADSPAGPGNRKLLGAYRIGATSGSSGRPALLPFDEHELIGLIANAATARAIAGRPAGIEGRVRAAKVGSPSPWHLSVQVAGTLQDPRKPSLAISATRGLPAVVDELSRFGPNLLSAYPSVLRALALEQQAGALAIAPLQVFGSGEPFTPGTRAMVEAAWGSAPFDQYVTTEAGFVAVECSAHDGLHVLDDHVVVEAVDAEGRPAEPGTASDHVLVTVLGSRTLPLIRYQLDDSVTVATAPCACGRAGLRLASIAGRARALLSLPSAADPAVPVAVHPVVFSAVLDPAPVQSWQVVLAPARIEVRVRSPSPAFDQHAIAAQLRRSLVTAGAATVEVQVAVVDTIESTPGGKAARIVTT